MIQKFEYIEEHHLLVMCCFYSTLGVEDNIYNQRGQVIVADSFTGKILQTIEYDVNELPSAIKYCKFDNGDSIVYIGTSKYES